MSKVYIAVSKEEFKRQLVKADANGMREQLLIDAINANKAILGESALGRSSAKASKLNELLSDVTISGRKLEKAVIAALYD